MKRRAGGKPRACAAEKKMKIYIDAMGGDNAPKATVEGTLEALRKNPALEAVLGGPAAEVEPLLAGAEDVRGRIELDDAPEIITNHESPVMGVRKKTNTRCWPGACSAWDEFPASSGPPWLLCCPTGRVTFC